MKPKHQRMLVIAVCLVTIAGAVALLLRTFQEQLVFFYTPTQLESKLKDKGFDRTRVLRLGGLVKTTSVINLEGGGIRFIVTDMRSEFSVTYRGLIPSLFREGQGVVIEGNLIEERSLEAHSLLAKHDENYMPKEVVDALKASGKWQEGQETYP